MHPLSFTVVWHLKAAVRFLQEIIDLFFFYNNEKKNPSEMGFHVCEIPGKECSHNSCLSGKGRLSLSYFFRDIVNTRCAERSWDQKKDEWKTKKKFCWRWSCRNISR